jgi:hypothetical protein
MCRSILCTRQAGLPSSVCTACAQRTQNRPLEPTGGRTERECVCHVQCFSFRRQKLHKHMCVSLREKESPSPGNDTQAKAGALAGHLQPCHSHHSLMITPFLALHCRCHWPYGQGPRWRTSASQALWWMRWLWQERTTPPSHRTAAAMHSFNKRGRQRTRGERLCRSRNSCKANAGACIAGTRRCPVPWRRII